MPDSNSRPPATDERIQAGLRNRRRVQIAGWTALIGLIACFLVLLLFERQLEERIAIARGVLVLCLLAHFVCVAYLRFARCPACGERFLGTGARGFGSFTAMSQEKCDHCGVALTPLSIR